MTPARQVFEPFLKFGVSGDAEIFLYLHHFDKSKLLKVLVLVYMCQISTKSGFLTNFGNLLKLCRFECNPSEAALAIQKMYVMFSSLWPGDSFQPVLLS